MEQYLYNAILAWYDDSLTEYHGLDDQDWIDRVCERTGMSEEEYRKLLLEGQNG